jgi:ABC-type molybdenum transport system ATPase subunit/photorepair protein PhrA
MMLSARDYVNSVYPNVNVEIFDHLIQHFDAEPLLDKPVSTLSSGELQLLMIFICFLSEKELWLLDEPFQFLDPIRKGCMKTYLSAHLSEDKTLILITHNDDDVAEWTDFRMRL